MCHADAPSTPSPAAVTEEVAVPLPTGEELPALYAHPAAGPDGDPAPQAGRPAVLIVHDIYGRTPFYEDLAARLADAGFHALLPDGFFRQGPLPQRTQEAVYARRVQLDDLRALADYSAALDWLRARPEVAGARTGTIGFCMGGTMVLNLAAERGDLVTVCYYGFPRSSPVGPNPGPSPLERVAKMRGPMIGFWGELDEAVGMDNVAAFAASAERHGLDFEHSVYQGVGHGFLAQALTDPDHPGHGHASDSWERTLAFYRRHLG
jgi:carboxymethylenebutenolidase